MLVSFSTLISPAVTILLEYFYPAFYSCLVFTLKLYTCSCQCNQPGYKKKSAALKKAMVKKDVKSNVAAKKWL